MWRISGKKCLGYRLLGYTDVTEKFDKEKSQLKKIVFKYIFFEWNRVLPAVKISYISLRPTNWTTTLYEKVTLSLSFLHKLLNDKLDCQYLLGKT